MKTMYRRFATAPLLLAAFGVFACNAAAERPPGVEDVDAEVTIDTTLPESADAGETSCVPGDIRSCKVQLPSHNGVNSCFVGVTVCVDEVWSACMTPEDAEKMRDDLPDAADGG